MEFSRAIMWRRENFNLYPASFESLGPTEILGAASAGAFSRAWGTQYLIEYIPFAVSRQVTVYQVAVACGATVTGNFDLGVYDNTGASGAPGARLLNSGSTANSASAIVVANPADTVLAPGRYYLALQMDSTTSQSLGWTLTANKGNSMGVYEEVGVSLALPATATPVAFTRTVIHAPMISLKAVT